MGTKLRHVCCTMMVIVILAVSTNSAVANTEDTPNVHSEAAVLMSAKSGEVLFDKEANQKNVPSEHYKNRNRHSCYRTRELEGQGDH